MNDTDDYADEWDDLTEKDILVGILTELQQIRLLLSEADSDALSDSDEPTTYSCQRCPATVPADERERHARKQHKAPGDMIEEMFEVAE